MTNGTAKKLPAFIAYHVPDRDNAAWINIGAAWAHQDGKGFNLDLDVLPVNGRITLRAFEPKPATTEGGA